MFLDVCPMKRKNECHNIYNGIPIWLFFINNLLSSDICDDVKVLLSYTIQNVAKAGFLCKKKLKKSHISENVHFLPVFV